MRTNYKHYSEHPEAPKKVKRYTIDFSSIEFLELEREYNRIGSSYPEHKAALRLKSMNGQELQYLKQEIIATKSEHKYFSHKLKNITHWAFDNTKHIEQTVEDLRITLMELSKEIDWIQSRVDSM